MRKAMIVISLMLLVGLPLLYVYGRSMWVPMYQKVVGKRTVDQVLETYGKDAIGRLLPSFEQAGVAWPPKSIMLLAIKDEMKLELWVNTPNAVRHIRTYPIKAASGISGPKFREGDSQVPEGMYGIVSLNPNSSYHLSMKLSYPNAFDRKHAEIEGRKNLGGDIYIHGKAVSIGCLAIGDRAIEELFTLAATIAPENIDVVIAPSDPRKQSILFLAAGQPDWVKELYEQITKTFARYPLKP